MAGRKWQQSVTLSFEALLFHQLLIGFIFIGGVGTSSLSDSQVKPVSDANWTLILEGEWMLKFYAPWCPACQQIQSEWEDFAKESKALGITVAKVDVTQEPGLSGRFMVTTLPTIFHAKDGSFRRYLASRSVEDLQSYISERKWEAVDPLPRWKSPSSIPMMAMAGLFRLSVWIRHIHMYLTEKLHIPVWGSYAIFAFATLLTGLFFGLILVLIADCLCPSKPQSKDTKTEVYLKNLSSDDEPGNFSEDTKLSEMDNEQEDQASGEDMGSDEASGTEGQEDEDELHRNSYDDIAASGVRKRKQQDSGENEEDD
ncbi:thioredoxin-related transmembrane protein 4 [Polypterus senegalus]|nr:thioredoxin-related transmembrane protein 4 [Polypterus senegalus]